MKKHKKLVAVLLLLFLLLLAACSLAPAFSSKKIQNPILIGFTNKAKSDLSIETFSKDPNAPTVLPNIIIRAFTDATVKASSEDINLKLTNPDANLDQYYLTFSLSIDGETLYESGLVPPGKQLDSIRLSRALDPGEYNLSVFVQPYTMDDLFATNNFVFNVRLTAV